MSQDITLARSYLFVPANRPERLDRALASGADAVIIDLEDAVPPADKPTARAIIERWIVPEVSVLVRVNGSDTPWFDDDLALARLPGVIGIVLPKAESVAQLEHVAACCPETCRVYPIIETGAAFADLAALAKAPKVHRLMFGSLDLQIDLGVSEADGDELLYHRAQVVLASRLAGLPAPIDGVTGALDDGPLIETDTRRARAHGFRGKLCIHPRQIPFVHRAFAWSEEERAWAQRVLDAVRESGGAAVAVDGKMVDIPVIRRATQIMAAPITSA
jgi:citrate lyase subunit beta/citryl-CoA lyase